MTFMVKSHMKSSVFKTNTYRYLTHTWSDKRKTSYKLRVNYFPMSLADRVSTEKEKSFREIFFLSLFSRNFAPICFVKTCEIFATLKMRNWKKTLKCFRIFSFLFSHFREKVCEMRPKNFPIFRKTFRPLETLLADKGLYGTVVNRTRQF